VFKISNNSYFTLTKRSLSGRIGELHVNNKIINTPSMYYQNSHPGGGGDVTRFITYADLRNKRIPTLHNYYYMSSQGTFKFARGYEILNNESINTFMIRSREIFCGQREIPARNILVNPPNISQAHPYKNLTLTNWNPIALLDSGFGNFLLSTIENLVHTNHNPDPAGVFTAFQQVIPKYFEYCDNHSFDVMMALDYAGKYTDKQWADKPELQKIANDIVHSFDEQIRLLRESLHQLQSAKYDFAVFAPIHGKNTKQFTDFINRVLEMEKEEGKKFDGFGISTPIKPAERVLAVKAVRNTLEQHDDTRPIHALGAGAVKDIIPLVYAGVDMFDNVTSWRRATDGSGGSAVNVDNPNALGSFSSFLIPLVNRNGDIITTNQKNVLGYVKLNKINTNYSCDCDICNEFDMGEIKDLYRKGSGSEDFYLAKNLLYNHAINQYDFICRRLRIDISEDIDIMTFTNEITDEKYRDRTKNLIETLQHFN